MIMPISPTAFLISPTQLITISSESAAKPPTMGMKLSRENLAVFMRMPSADFVTTPCMAVIPEKTVTESP